MGGWLRYSLHAAYYQQLTTTNEDNTMNKLTTKTRHLGKKASLALTTALAAGMANAGPLADAFTGEADSAKAEILLIGAAIMIVCGVIFFIRSGKKAAN